jgi:hypothetical protein
MTKSIYDTSHRATGTRRHEIFGVCPILWLGTEPNTSLGWQRQPSAHSSLRAKLTLWAFSAFAKSYAHQAHSQRRILLFGYVPVSNVMNPIKPLLQRRFLIMAGVAAFLFVFCTLLVQFPSDDAAWSKLSSFNSASASNGDAQGLLDPDAVCFAHCFS